MSEARQQRILVVSDDPEAGALVQAILTGGGFAVGLVSNRDVTMEQIEVGLPELVVMDALTPNLADWPILVELVQLADAPPIVLLTGRCVSPLTLAALTQNVSGHLSKPFAAAALIDKCRRLLTRTSEPVPPGGRERRREARLRFLGQATLLTASGAPLVVADLIEVSSSGARIGLAAAPIDAVRPGRKLRLVLSLPPGFEPIELESRVEWHRENAIGVSFAESSAEARGQFEERLKKAFPHRDHSMREKVDRGPR